jgi:hypothetical protein
MALDGVLNSLSSAFDAGVALLIRGVEDARDVAVDDRLPVFRYRWEACRDLLKQADISNDQVWRLILDVDNALDGETRPEPVGWLAQLRRLRNRVAHQDSLARHHDVDGSVAVAGLSIDGRKVDALMYATTMCDRVHELSEQMIRTAIGIGARETATPSTRAWWDPPA